MASGNRWKAKYCHECYCIRGQEPCELCYVRGLKCIGLCLCCREYRENTFGTTSQGVRNAAAYTLPGSGGTLKLPVGTTLSMQQSSRFPGTVQTQCAFRSSRDINNSASTSAARQDVPPATYTRHIEGCPGSACNCSTVQRERESLGAGRSSSTSTQPWEPGISQQPQRTRQGSRGKHNLGWTTVNGPDVLHAPSSTMQKSRRRKRSSHSEPTAPPGTTDISKHVIGAHRAFLAHPSTSATVSSAPADAQQNLPSTSASHSTPGTSGPGRDVIRRAPTSAEIRGEEEEKLFLHVEDNFHEVPRYMYVFEEGTLAAILCGISYHLNLCRACAGLRNWPGCNSCRHDPESCSMVCSCRNPRLLTRDRLIRIAPHTSIRAIVNTYRSGIVTFLNATRFAFHDGYVHVFASPNTPNKPNEVEQMQFHLEARCLTCLEKKEGMARARRWRKPNVVPDNMTFTCCNCGNRAMILFMKQLKDTSRQELTSRQKDDEERVPLTPIYPAAESPTEAGPSGVQQSLTEAGSSGVQQSLTEAGSSGVQQSLTEAGPSGLQQSLTQAGPSGLQQMLNQPVSNIQNPRSGSAYFSDTNQGSSTDVNLSRNISSPPLNFPEVPQQSSYGYGPTPLLVYEYVKEETTFTVTIDPTKAPPTVPVQICHRCDCTTVGIACDRCKKEKCPGICPCCNKKVKVKVEPTSATPAKTSGIGAQGDTATPTSKGKGKRMADSSDIQVIGEFVSPAKRRTTDVSTSSPARYKRSPAKKSPTLTQGDTSSATSEGARKWPADASTSDIQVVGEFASPAKRRTTDVSTSYPARYKRSPAKKSPTLTQGDTSTATPEGARERPADASRSDIQVVGEFASPAKRRTADVSTSSPARYKRSPAKKSPTLTQGDTSTATSEGPRRWPADASTSSNIRPLSGFPYATPPGHLINYFKVPAIPRPRFSNLDLPGQYGQPNVMQQPFPQGSTIGAGILNVPVAPVPHLSFLNLGASGQHGYPNVSYVMQPPFAQGSATGAQIPNWPSTTTSGPTFPNVSGRICKHCNCTSSEVLCNICRITPCPYCRGSK